MIETIKLWVQNLEKEREEYVIKRNEYVSHIPDDMRELHPVEFKNILPSKLDDDMEMEEIESIKFFLKNEIALKETVMSELIYEIYILKCRMQKFDKMVQQHEYGSHEQKHIDHKKKHIYSYKKEIDALQASLKYIDIIEGTMYKKKRGGGSGKRKKRMKRGTNLTSNRRTFRKSNRKNNIKTRRRL